MKHRTILITLITFGVYYVLDDIFFNDLRSLINNYIGQIGVSHNLTYLISGIPLFIGVRLIHKRPYLFESLGFRGSFTKAFFFALMCTLPMVIGYAIVFDFNEKVGVNSILISAVAAAFFEEVFFRGFLFGQLFRFTRLGFFPSVILGSLLFGIIHLYQSRDLITAIGIFSTTFLGAILFAWLYVEWKNNIWVPIFIHFFMNLIWLLFSVADNALGGLYANLFRITSIVLIVSSTFLIKRKNGLPLEVSKSSIWMKQNMK